MEQNCNHNKTQLLAHLSSMIWKLEKQFIKDAEEANHPLCAKECEELSQDLKKHQEKLRQAVEGLSREGKFK